MQEKDLQLVRMHRREKIQTSKGETHSSLGSCEIKYLLEDLSRVRPRMKYHKVELSSP